MAAGATELINRMRGNVRVILEYLGLLGETWPPALGMTGQTMFLMGRATEVNGYIRDDPGMLLPARMQGAIFSPALVGCDQHQAQG
jgi:hypothetical protein